MLTGIRTAFSSGFLRLLLIALMGLLVVSFAIWGIGDIFRGGTSTTLAQVGGTSVQVSQFQTVYNREVQQFGQLQGRGVTPDQARQLGIDRRVLDRLVTEATLDERARVLGLGIDDASIRDRIVSQPTFRGADGRFDRAGFQELLRANGLTEQGYIDLERRLALRQQIAAAVSDRAPVPRTIIDALARFQAETRTADYVTIGARNVGDVPAPDAAVLQRFFEQRRAAFRAPQYRRALVLVASPEEQAPFMQVDEDRLTLEFNRLRDERERRTLQQITFATPEEAALAASRLASGATFEDIARERNVTTQDLDLGTLSRGQVADPAVREAAFALEEGAVSAPVRGRFGTVLVRAVRIVPFNAEAVREETRRRLAADLARRSVTEIHDRIERARLTGTPLADIARDVGLAAATIESVDQNGLDASGLALDLAGGREFLTALFRSEVGLDNDPVTIRQTGTYIWYEVLGITQARDRTLDEVRETAEARWREEEVRDRINKAAAEMVRVVRAGTPLPDVAKSMNLEVRTSSALTRAASDSTWSANAVATLFATAQGQTANAVGPDGLDQIVFTVRDVQAPANQAVDPQTLSQLRESIESDLILQFVQRLRLDYGATVNQTLLRRAVGGGEN